MDLAMHVRETVQLPALAERHSRRVVYAVFVFIASAVSIGAITAVAYGCGHPLVAPSLGPTAFLVFNRSHSSVARPRNIVLGHLIGAVSGYLALIAFGLQDAPSVVDGGISSSRIGAAALSIALTSAVMILSRTEHGPAGATTLIVSLGFMATLGALSLLMAGVVFLAALGVLIDRFVGLGLPYWSGTQLRARPLLSYLPWRPALPKDETGGNGHRPAPPSDFHPPSEDGKEISTWVVGPGEGRRFPIGSEECTLKVEDAHATGAYSLLEVVFDPQRPSTLLHAHYDFAETYFVLDGEVVAEMGSERRRTPAGSTISVPVGIPHLLNAAGRRPARCLCVTNRARHSDLEYLP